MKVVKGLFNVSEKQLKEKKLEADGMIEELAQVKDFRKKKNEMQVCLFRTENHSEIRS